MTPLLPLAHGTRLGRYRIERTLGEGAFGTVYQARVRESGRTVALKVVHAHHHDKLAGGLQREFMAGRLLRHPNVCRVLDLVEIDDWLALVMEHVDGATLGQVLRVAERKQRPLPAEVIVELGRQAAAGLVHIHHAADERGRPLRMVHRDLKPSNLMVDRQGVLKIMDFGVANADLDLFQQVSSGIKGTFRYMAPEQLVSPRDADHRADLFSLGAVLFELATGDLLFDASTLPTLLEQANKGAHLGLLEAADRRVPGLALILGRLLRRSPEQRYASATELIRALDALDVPPVEDLSTWMTPWLPQLDPTGDMVRRSPRPPAPTTSTTTSTTTTRPWLLPAAILVAATGLCLGMAGLGFGAGVLLGSHEPAPQVAPATPPEPPPPHADRTITITSDPLGLEVELDGLPLGPSPVLDQPVEDGGHALRVGDAKREIRVGPRAPTRFVWRQADRQWEVGS